MYHKGQEIWLVEYPVMKGLLYQTLQNILQDMGLLMFLFNTEKIHTSNILYPHWTFLIQWREQLLFVHQKQRIT